MRLFGFLLAALLLTLAGCRKPEADIIKIGHFASMTGPTATFGQSTDKGIRLAIDEINRQGGVLGKKIVVITEDDAGKTEEAAAAVQKLITRDRVVAILGEVASSRSIVGGNICEARGIPMISPSSTNPKVTQGKKWVFRICFTDDFQGAAMARFCYENLKARRAAILKDRKNEYSVGLAEFFAKTFERLGGRIVAHENYQEGDVDFKPQLAKIKAANPDVLFVPGYYTECGLILKQVRRDLGMDLPVTGGDGWDSASLIQEIRGDLEGKGVHFGNHFSPYEQRPEVQEFVKKFKERYGELPDAMAALGYDAARILADAIKRAGSVEPAKIRDAIEQTKDFPGVTGRITIDENHNARKPLLVLQIKDGKTKVIATIPPMETTQPALFRGTSPLR
jgi:branched-chain amino acid transport system substrate-binding protein